MYSFHFPYKKKKKIEVKEKKERKEKNTFTTIISGALNRTQKVVQIICIKSTITHTRLFYLTETPRDHINIKSAITQ